jgi:glycosyltransferase involved in cell wall biosynthesis
MNILLISISAPPKNSPESLQTGRYLKYLSRKHSITLLTSDVTGGWEPEDKGLSKYLNNVHRVISVFSPPYRAIVLLKKIFPSLLIPDDAASFFWQFKRALRKIDQKPDVVFSRSAPYSSAIMGMKMSRYWNVPWIMHLSDLWTDSPFSSMDEDVKQKHLQLERECFETAAVVTLTSHKTISFYKKKYPQIAHKFQFLPNVFDQDDYNKTHAALNGKIRFVFTGRLYGTRSIHRFLDQMEKTFSSRPDLEDRSEILLAGFFDEHNVQRIKTSPLKNVKYLGALDLNEAIELQQNAHVLVLIDSLEDDPRYDLFFPSKLLDYLAANRLIVALTNKNSTTYDVVEDKIGKCFYPENFHEFPAYMTMIIEQLINGIQPAIKADDISQYEASVNTKRLEEIFTTAISTHA